MSGSGPTPTSPRGGWRPGQFIQGARHRIQERREHAKETASSAPTEAHPHTPAPTATPGHTTTTAPEERPLDPGSSAANAEAPDFRILESFAMSGGGGVGGTSEVDEEEEEEEHEGQRDRNASPPRGWYPGKLLKKRIRKAMDRAVKPDQLEGSQVSAAHLRLGVYVPATWVDEISEPC
jgi:hypothetical protein